MSLSKEQELKRKERSVHRGSGGETRGDLLTEAKESQISLGNEVRYKMTGKNVIPLDNLEEYGDIMQSFKLRNQIIKYGGKKKTVVKGHWCIPGT